MPTQDSDPPDVTNAADATNATDATTTAAHRARARANVVQQEARQHIQESSASRPASRNTPTIRPIQHGVLSTEAYAALLTLARELLPTNKQLDSTNTLRPLTSDASAITRERYNTLLATRQAWGMLEDVYTRQIAQQEAHRQAQEHAQGTQERQQQGEQDTAPLLVLLACAYYLQERCYLDALSKQEQHQQEYQQAQEGEQIGQTTLTGSVAGENTEKGKAKASSHE